MSTVEQQGPEQLSPQQRGGVVTLLFTDIVGSTALKQQLGDKVGLQLIQRHHELLRQALAQFPGAREIKTAGDSFFLTFPMPSTAVSFALLLQARLREFNANSGTPVQDRVGIHLGEVTLEGGEQAMDLHGLSVDLCARVMSLAQAGQVLMTRPVFDNARQSLKGEELEGTGALSWLNHGRFELKGVDEPVEICEVRAGDTSAISAPTTSEKARRVESAEGEAVLGWRPAVGQVVPNTKWILEEKLGEGGFGEVWKARHEKLSENRVFKFCFRADRVRSLKREVTLFRLLKERIGEHPNIVKLYDIFFDEPPYYLEEEYVAGKDLRSWCEAQGGVEKIPLEVKLELVAQAADALQAAHDSGVIHRDVKPGNILVANQRSEVGGQRSDSQPSTLNQRPSAKLTDFGIGQVISEEYLKDVTSAGFTQTMMSTSSAHAGTQLYMAPELLSGKAASIRSDVYSLGIVLYQMLIGDLGQPLTSDWADAVTDLLLREDLKHCLAGKPEERFAAAALLAQSLRRYAERRRDYHRQREAEIRARRKQRLFVIAAGVAAIGLLVAVALAYGLRQAALNLQTSRARLYAAEINQASHAFQENNLGTALELLERQQPAPGERDLRGWEWRYLWQLCRSDELRTLGSHSNFVTGVRFSPDGKWLASSSRDKTVKIWEIEKGKVLASFAHPGYVKAIDVSPDGRWLATGTAYPPGPLRLWDTRTWQESKTLAADIAVGSLTFSSDGQYLASVGDVAGQEKVVIRNLGTGEVVASFAAIGAGLGSQDLCFSPKGQLLAYLQPDAVSVSLWDMKEGTNRFSFPARDMVSAMTFSPDGNYLAAGSWGKTVSVWDVSSRLLAATLSNHTAWVSALCFSPGGDTLATASADQQIKLWNTTNWLEVASLKGHRHEVWALAFSPNGRMLASGGKDDTIRLWSSTSQQKPGTVLTLPDVRWVAPSPTGNFWLTPYIDGNLGVWDSASLTECARVPPLSAGDKGQVCAVSGDGALIAQGAADRKVVLRTPKSGERLAVFDPGGLTPLGLWFSPDGSRLAVACEAGPKQVLQVWEVAAKRAIVVFTNELPSISAPPVFSPNNRELGTAHLEGWVAIWNLKTGQPETVLRAHPADVHAVGFSLDGQMIATTGDEGTLKLWSRTSRNLLASLRGQLLTLHCVAFSPDGKRVAAGTGDGLVKIWDTGTYQEVGTLRTGAAIAVNGLAFLRQGDTLVATTGLEIFAWRAASFAEIQAAEMAQQNRARRP